METKGDDVVCFLLSGQEFTVLLSTLNRHDCYLTTLVSKRWNTFGNDNNRFIIDRNPKSFAHVLEHLQGYDLDFDSMDKSTMKLLIQDAHFYSLPEILSQFEEYRNKEDKRKRWRLIPDKFKDMDKHEIAKLYQDCVYLLWTFKNEGELVDFDDNTLGTKKDKSKIVMCETIMLFETVKKRIEERDKKKCVIAMYTSAGEVVAMLLNKTIGTDITTEEFHENVKDVVNASNGENLEWNIWKTFAVHTSPSIFRALQRKYDEYINRKPWYSRFYSRMNNVAYGSYLKAVAVVSKLKRQ